MKQYIISQLFALLALLGFALLLWAVAACIETMTLFYLTSLPFALWLIAVGGIGFYVYTD